MGPEPALPLPGVYYKDDEYVNDLLEFVSGSDLFQQLCGGVHVLDFFTRSPPLYEWLLDEEWREWVETQELSDVLEFILREDVDVVRSLAAAESTIWRGKPAPPPSFAAYVAKIRSLTLCRDIPASKSGGGIARKDDSLNTIPRDLSVGMDDKKIHEVENFAHFVQDLSDHVAACNSRPITHFVDFGSGKNYLGRTLASRPYNKHVIAVESKHENVEAAEALDVHAKVAPKLKVMRNKKEFQKLLKQRTKREGRPRSEVLKDVLREDKEKQRAQRSVDDFDGTDSIADAVITGADGAVPILETPTGCVLQTKLDRSLEGSGSVQHVIHRLEDGNLENVIAEIVDESAILTDDSNGESIHRKILHKIDRLQPRRPSLMVMSIHSCGNLVHHGLRSLILNPSVSTVALVGCCYNLVSERLTSPTYKLPSLRPAWNGEPPERFSEKLARCAGGDPHGYPMSARLCNYPTREGKGIHLNITARMMAVQVPLGWVGKSSADFFSRHFYRHFYRALLQRIFLDRGVVDPPADSSLEPNLGYGENRPDLEQLQQLPNGNTSQNTSIPPRERTRGKGGGTQPIIVGSLRKTSYIDFTTYVRAAVSKLSTPGNHHPALASTDLASILTAKMSTITDGEIAEYERAYAKRKKELSVVWTLMAFSAQLVEAIMVVDRWLWLREQGEVGPGRCWVEAVFEYGKSPRNLVVVGVKKEERLEDMVSSS